MFKKILSLFKNQSELVSPLTDSVSAAAMPSATAIPPRMARSRRKKKKSDPDWISVPQEPTTAELLLGLPSEYKVLNDLLVTNPKSRSGYSQIDHVVIGPRAIFVIKMYNPLMQHRARVEAIQAHLGDYKRVRLVSMVTFTNRCRISVDPDVRYVNSDEMVIYDHELVETIQRKTERLEAELPETLYKEQDTQMIWNMLNAANSTDYQVRAEHMAKAKGIK